MPPRLLSCLAGAALLAACGKTGMTPPSLGPRAAETIDPRLPVERPIVQAPADRAVSQRLAALLDEARSGDAAFRAALGPAERAAASAGAPQSESWIAAQQLLSALEAARGPTARAVGAIDAIAGEGVKARGGIASADLAAIDAASAEAGAIDRRQSEAIAALAARLGI